MNSSEVWDEEKILKVKKILFNKWEKICFGLKPTPITRIDGELEWKSWLNDNKIKSYKELWTCVQFLDNDHIMVDISPKIPFGITSSSLGKYKTFLIVPKDFANKLIVLSTFED